MNKRKTFMNWSGGKDSALSLYRLLENPGVHVDCLLTSMNTRYDRVSMHGVRRELVLQQANAIGLPLITLDLPEQPSLQEYEELLGAKLNALTHNGFTTAVFGDIFLEDLRNYREQQLARVGLEAVFPLWKVPSAQLMDEFLQAGFKAIVVCVNEKYLDKSFCGRIIDRSFLKDLPSNVDICGEHGEYHSFVFDGPVFKHPVSFRKGELIRRTYASPKSASSASCSTDTGPEYGFYYCDLLTD